MTGEYYPRVHYDELDADGRALYHALVAGPRASVPGQFPIRADDESLNGPFGVFLFAPSVGMPLQELGARIRTRAQLSHPLRELATLAVASSLGCDFEVRAHRELAIQTGIPSNQIDRLIAGELPDDPREAILVDFCRSLAHEVAPRDAFDALAGQFDRTEVVEVIALVGYYRTLAGLLELLRIDEPASAKPSAQPATDDGHDLAATEGRDLAASVNLLMQEREIRNLLVALARTADQKDFDGVAQLYAVDGELVTPWGTHAGREGLADHIRKDLEVFPRLHHVSAGHEVDYKLGANRASARMTLLATHVLDDLGTDFTTVGGHYEIDLIHELGRWRLQRVSIHPAWRFETSPSPARSAGSCLH